MEGTKSQMLKLSQKVSKIWLRNLTTFNKNELFPKLFFMSYIFLICETFLLVNKDNTYFNLKGFIYKNW